MFLSVESILPLRHRHNDHCYRFTPVMITPPSQDAELESRFQLLLEEKEGVEKGKEELQREKEELLILENKIKDDVSRGGGINSRVT